MKSKLLDAINAAYSDNPEAIKELLLAHKTGGKKIDFAYPRPSKKKPDFAQSWMRFKDSPEYKTSIAILTHAGMEMSLRQNIVLVAFSAGFNAAKK
jgi:hypothetical protein